MKNNLKVGESFEVVEVLGHNFGSDYFKIGGWTTKLDWCSFILNGNETTDVEKFLGQNVLCLPVSGEKKVGKLTITKLK